MPWNINQVTVLNNIPKHSSKQQIYYENTITMFLWREIDFYPRVLMYDSRKQ